MKKLFLLLGCVLMAATMSATTYKGCCYQANDNYWTQLPYDENGEVAITVQVSDDKSTVTLKDWTGDAGVDLALTIGEDGRIAQMNGKDPDSYGSQWLGIGSLTDGGYSGIYGYYPLYSLVTINEDGSGEGYFEVYSYEPIDEEGTAAGYRYVYFRWDTDTVEEITETKYAGSVYSGDTEDEDNDSWMALPYGENGEYEVTIGVASDLSYITIYNWTGETVANNAVNVKLMLDADGNVQTINGYQDSGWGIDTGTVEDSGYWTVYVYPSYSYVEFAAEDGSEGAGYFYIYTFAEPAGYKSINFYWPTETESDGIKNVNAAAQNGNIYNVAGQAVNGDLQKGLYIKGGKKFIVK